MPAAEAPPPVYQLIIACNNDTNVKLLGDVKRLLGNGKILVDAYAHPATIYAYLKQGFKVIEPPEVGQRNASSFATAAAFTAGEILSKCGYTLRDGEDANLACAALLSYFDARKEQDENQRSRIQDAKFRGDITSSQYGITLSHIANEFWSKKKANAAHAKLTKALAGFFATGNSYDPKKYGFYFNPTLCLRYDQQGGSLGIAGTRPLLGQNGLPIGLTLGAIKNSCTGSFKKQAMDNDSGVRQEMQYSTMYAANAGENIYVYAPPSNKSFFMAVPLASGDLQNPKHKDLNAFISYCEKELKNKTKKKKGKKAAKKAQNFLGLPGWQIMKKGAQKGKKFKKNYSFRPYIYKVLKQVHPDQGIQKIAMKVMESFVDDVVTRLAVEAGKIARYNKKSTLGSRAVQTAVRLTLPGELAKHAVSEGTKAVTKYTTAEDTTGNATNGSKKNKTNTKSSKSGLQFPVARVERMVKLGKYAKRIGEAACVYLTAVVEYMVAEVLEQAGNATRDARRKRVVPRTLMLAIRNDEELNEFLRGVTIPDSGVIPLIHKSLFKKKNKKT